MTGLVKIAMLTTHDATGTSYSSRVSVLPWEPEPWKLENNALRKRIEF